MAPCQAQRRTHSPSRRRSGFTLIELLVVISIISLLISVLLPALSTARQSASAVQCSSNLRQVINAVLMYANDNGDRPPFCAWNRQEADDSIAGYGSYGGALAVNGYLDDPQPYYCPTRNDSPDYWGSRTHLGQRTSSGWGHKSARWQYVSYGGNRFGFMPRAADTPGSRPAPRSLANLGGRASELIGLAEAFQTNYADSNRFGTDQIRPGAATHALYTAHPSDSGNHAFADGHVERIAARELDYNPATGAYGSWTSALDRTRAPWLEQGWN